jgi:hypothetical protein
MSPFLQAELGSALEFTAGITRREVEDEVEDGQSESPPFRRH